jgi:hypothetical protein
MMDEPNSRYGRDEHEAAKPDAALPPELEVLAQRLSADGAYWQRRLPDTTGVADRIRAIPLTTPRIQDERRALMSTQVGLPPETGPRTQQTGGRPPRLGPQRGLLATLAAVLIVGLIAVVLVQFVQQHGTSTGPVGQPTQTQTQPLPTQTQPAPTATATPSPTGTWTSIQAFTGSGNYRSASFQVTSPWRLVWQCNLSMGNAGPYPLKVDVLPSSGSGGNLGVINTVCKTGNTRGTSAEQTTPTGLVYLRISSAADGEWDVRVQMLR